VIRAVARLGRHNKNTCTIIYVYSFHFQSRRDEYYPTSTQHSPNPELWDFELISDKHKRSMRHMSVTILLLEHFMDALEMETKHHVYPKILGYLKRVHIVFNKFAEDYLQMHRQDLQFSDDNVKENIKCVVEELKFLASNIKSGVNIFPKLRADPKANDIIHKFASRFTMRIQEWFVHLNYWISKMSAEEKHMYNLSQS